MGVLNGLHTTNHSKSPNQPKGAYRVEESSVDIEDDMVHPPLPANTVRISEPEKKTRLRRCLKSI